MGCARRFLLVLALLGVGCWLGLAEAQIRQEWVARYNGPGNGYDKANAMAVDSAGNVYVTGESYGSGTYLDYATIKYDSSGNQLWVARYNGPANGYDSANAMALDSAGNVYVTGESWGSGTYLDYATIKYDSSGNQLWVARYNGPGNTDEAYAMALDSAGNIYVAGVSWGIGTYTDYATIKYDSSGNQLWVARYNGPGNSGDEAYAMALDSAGNVYVTGYSWGSGTNSDYATIKYDSSGNQLWVARYNGPANDSDYATAMALDSASNVYVTGYSRDSGTYDDYATIKYDSSGNQLWVARYNGPANDFDYATAMALDSASNVYVTGYSPGSGTGSDYATIKYDSSGNQLWVARYNGPTNDSDVAWAMALDSAGNVYVAGVSWGIGTYTDYATIKYSQVTPPDLTISSSDISFEPPGPADPGTPVTIKANIHNQGGTDATGDVSFYYDDTSHLIGKVTGHAVTAGRSAMAQVVWNTTGRGPRKYPIIVVISNANPAESDTSNNQAQADYTLPVELASFEAKAGDGEILLTWVTESETDNYGWNIYRATEPDGAFSRINTEVIPGAGTSPVAHFYSYLDQGLSNGTTYYYYLEDIRLDGQGERSFIVSASPAAGKPALNFKPFKEEKKPVKLIPTPIPYPGELEGPRYFPIPQAKLLVEQKGSYRITYSDLAAAGIDVSGIDTRYLTLTNKGKPVPLLISDGGDGRLDSGDYLEFEGSFNAGTYTYEDIYSRVNVYWLSWWLKDENWLGTSPSATKDEGWMNLEGTVPELRTKRSGAVDSRLSPHQEAIHLEQDNIFSRLGHAPDGQRDHWFWAQVDAPGSFSVPFMIKDYKSIGETIRVKVRLQGNSHLASEPDHYVQLFLNGKALGEIYWDGQEDYLLEKEVPVRYLYEGKNIFKIVVPGFEFTPMASPVAQNSPFMPEAIDSVFLDWLEISYRPSASLEMLQLPLKPRAIVPDFPSDLRNSDNAADYIIITHSDFYESASRLAEFREQGGLRTKVVDITDIYDEFSYGIFNPEAIKSFLQYTYRYWQKPAPAYVLLLGDASEDYKDNSHTGSRNYVPSYPYFAPGFGQTISDHWFACLEGKDEVPEVSIGRLPARSREEAEVMVDKIINYRASMGSDKVLFINGGYDIEDEEFFDESSEGLIQKYLGNLYQAVRVYGQPSREDLRGYQSGKAEIIEAINGGVGIINFLGHAASRTWDLLFSKKDIPWLHNSASLPIILSMTCHTGHFATTPGSDQGQGFRIINPVQLQTFPGQIVMLDDGDSFAEAFLKKRDGGAIAFLGNTAMGLLYGDSYLDDELFKALFQRGITTLGPAIDEAKRMVLKNHPGYQHLISTFVLLGDPALELKVR